MTQASAIDLETRAAAPAGPAPPACWPEGATRWAQPPSLTQSRLEAEAHPPPTTATHPQPMTPTHPPPPRRRPPLAGRCGARRCLCQQRCAIGAELNEHSKQLPLFTTDARTCSAPRSSSPSNKRWTRSAWRTRAPRSASSSRLRCAPPTPSTSCSTAGEEGHRRKGRR